AFAGRYLELLAEADTSGWEPRPGAAEGLARLQAEGLRLALVTGNPEPMARARLQRLGLARFFPPGEGAFGCEAEERGALLELPLEPRLPRIGSVDQVAVEARATDLSRRSIKRETKLFALDLAVRMMDLTTLEGADTPGKVAALASKAVRPDPSDASIPSVAAVCVYPNLVQTARERVGDSGVKVASVATAFPS